MRMRYVLPAMLLLAMVASGLGASARADDRLTAEDFIDTASAMNRGEIDAAEMALERDSASPEVKAFAQRLLEDHRRMDEAMAQLAAERSLDMSRMADVRSLGNATRLALLRGETFDREFLEAQVAAHERFLALMERAAQELEDPGLKEFASQHRPHLSDHLEQAKKLLASRSE